jgi:hypothetical protein
MVTLPVRNVTPPADTVAPGRAGSRSTLMSTCGWFETSRRLPTFDIMSISTLGNAAVVIGIVIAVLARRLSWSELENSDTDVWRGPLVMCGIGLYQMHDKLTGTTLGPVDVVLLVLGVALALVAGLATGRVAQVEHRGTKVFYRLGLPGLAVMVCYLVLRLGLAGVGHLLDATISSGGGSLLLTLGANLLVQSVIVQSKAHRQAEEYASR